MFISLLCAVSSNLDTLFVCISYSVKNIKLPKLSMFIISLISSIGTYCSMIFGKSILKYAHLNHVELFGSVILILMGLYFVYDCTLKQDYAKTILLDDPTIADADNSGVIDFKEAVILATVLTINNIGVGISCAIVGISIYLTTFFTWLTSLIAMYIGFNVSSKFPIGNFGKLSQILAGIIIIFVGVIKILF